MQQQKHLFIGGLNTDDDFQVLPPGDYPDALNFRTGSSQSGRLGTGETIWGTAIVDTYITTNQDDLLPEPYEPVFPDGTKCIGYLEDRANSRGYFWIYRPGGNHGIYRYEPENQTIYTIIESPILNFTEGMRIDQATAFSYYNPDGVKNTFLSYTDGLNHPRLFNTDLIEKTRWVEVLDYWLNLDKAPPVAPLKVVVRADATAQKELKEGVYQFVYRYLYKDGLRSTWSPISIPVSLTKENIDEFGFNRIDLYQQYYMFGATEAEVIANDGLNDLPFGDPRLSYISEIEIAYRYSDADNWQLAYRGEMADKATPVYTLSSNSNQGNVASTSIALPYSNVPLKCKALAGMTNRIFCGNNETDVPEINNIIFEDTGVYVNGDSGIDFMESAAASDFTNAPSLYLRNRFEKNTFLDANYSIGIVFKNEYGKRSPVITSPELRRRMVKLDSSIGGQLLGIPAFGFKIVDDVMPPYWATSYEIVRTRASDVSFGFAAIANRFYFFKKDDTVPFGYVRTDPGNASFFAVDASNFYNTTGADDPRTKDNELNEIYYNFQEGDRITIGNMATTYPIVKDVEGHLLVAISDELKTEFGSQLDSDKGGGAIHAMIRRTYDVELPAIFYSSGEWYPILYPKSESLAFSKSDWTYTGNATVQEQSAGGFTWYDNYPFRNGDAYSVSKRYYVDRVEFPVFGFAYNYFDNTFAQMNPYANKVAQEWERGDLWADVTNEKNTIKTLETQVVFGGQFIPDARVNNLNIFSGSDQYVYPMEYGALSELRPGQNQEVESAGAILVAGFVNETLAIYINRTTMANLNGSTEVLQSDKVLGSFNALVGSWGTMHPSGTACSDGRQYRLDMNKGIVHRYSRDGLTAISKIKMKKFFKEKLSAFRPNWLRVAAGYDYGNQEYVLTIMDSEIPSINVTIAFNEDVNRWVTRYSYLPECYGSVGTLFLSFKDGRLYRHNAASESPNAFHEEDQVASYVETVTNGLDEKLQSEIKTFEQFTQEADVAFVPVWQRTASRIGVSQTPETFTMPEEIAVAETKFSGAIMKDINSVNTVDPRINGKDMRGYWLHTRWQYLPSVYSVNLFAINVGYNLSKPSTQK